MLSDTFFGLIALLYYVCFTLLVGLVVFIGCQGGHRTPARSRLRRTFFLLAISLLIWQFTLFLEVRIPAPATQLWLGRINFTAIVFTVYLALRFVKEAHGDGSIQRSSVWSLWLLAETGILAALTLLTPLVDAAERVDAGHAISTYGPFFPGYLAHVFGYLVAALIASFRERRFVKNSRVRRQLTFIGLGMLATGSVAIMTNVVLPYLLGDFRFSDMGALSTVCFVLAVAYATFIHGLFDPRVIVRETLVYGFLMVFVLSAYSSAIFLITQYLTDGTGKATQFAVLIIAFSLDPLRRLMENKTDRLLFDRGKVESKRKKRRGR